MSALLMVPVNGLLRWCHSSLYGMAPVKYKRISVVVGFLGPSLGTGPARLASVPRNGPPHWMRSNYSTSFGKELIFEVLYRTILPPLMPACPGKSHNPHSPHVHPHAPTAIVLSSANKKLQTEA